MSRYSQEEKSGLLVHANRYGHSDSDGFIRQAARGYLQANEQEITIKLHNFEFPEEIISKKSLFACKQDLEKNSEYQHASRLKKVHLLLSKKNPRWLAAISILDEIIRNTGRYRRRNEYKANYARVLAAICHLQMADYYDRIDYTAIAGNERANAVRYLAKIDDSFAGTRNVSSSVNNKTLQAMLNLLPIEQYLKCIYTNVVVRKSIIYNAHLLSYALITIGNAQLIRRGSGIVLTSAELYECADKILFSVKYFSEKTVVDILAEEIPRSTNCEQFLKGVRAISKRHIISLAPIGVRGQFEKPIECSGKILHTFTDYLERRIKITDGAGVRPRLRG